MRDWFGGHNLPPWLWKLSWECCTVQEYCVSPAHLRPRDDDVDYYCISIEWVLAGVYKKFSKNVYIKRKDFIPECLVSGRTVWWSSSLFKYLCIQGKIYLKGDGCQKRHFRYIIIYSTYSNNRTVWNSGMYRRKNFLKISNNCTWPSWFYYSTLSTRLGF